MQKVLIFGSFLLLLKIITNVAFAAPVGFLPENNLSIADDKVSGGISEAQFIEVIKKVEKTYLPIADIIDVDLVFYKSWSSNTVNAYADRSDDRRWNVTFYGGLARHETITVDGFTLVVCHELGHHFAGAPQKTGNNWSSAEGQADYYGPLKCLRRVWEKENNQAIVATLNVPPLVQEKCQESFTQSNDQMICIRSSMAGLSVALLMQALEYESIVPQFTTPDQSIAPMMNLMHPAPQCRLDTYFQGALCPVDVKVELDEGNTKKGTCHPANGHQTGNRPACWFKY